MGRTPRQLDAALGRLANAEDRFLSGEFLAPVVRGASVQIRIAGVVCRMAIEPRDYEGWGVFRPLSLDAARLVREAGLAERQRYLSLFPRVRLIVCRRQGEEWLAVQAHRGDARIRIQGLVPILLAEPVQPFEIVLCRCDGARFWYEGTDPRRDPAAAAWLRAALAAQRPPEELGRPGLTPEERVAYALNYLPLAEARRQAEAELRRAEADRHQDRLRQALAHAGADYLDYLDQGEVYRVRYQVDGREHHSVITKADLSVQSAGICLSGEDGKFDLASLIGVLREGRDEYE
jgi:hypothetical protein